MWRNQNFPPKKCFPSKFGNSFTQKEIFLTKYSLLFLFLTFWRNFAPRKKPNILTEYSFSFYFSHFGEISHQKNTKYTDEIFLFIFSFHILANFCTKQNANNIDRLFLFIFILHILGEVKFRTKQKRQIYGQIIPFYFYF
jgi:hypothetical protein